MAAPVGGCGFIHQLDFSGGQMGHQEEEKEIGGDVQIEIDETVHEKAAASDETGELQSAREGLTQLAQSYQRLTEQDAKEPRATHTSKKPCLCQGFEVVIVRVVDNLSIVERFVRGINNLQSAEAGAG